MARRTRDDALKPLTRRSWLVVRARHRQPLQARELGAGAALRDILVAARSAREADGWNCTPLGRMDGCFFCDRDGQRLQIGIELYDPFGALAHSPDASG